MTDISDKLRTFLVWLDHGYVGIERVEELVDVPAGIDANALCAEVLDDMMGTLDYDWGEV